MDGSDQAWSTSITCLVIRDATPRILVVDSSAHFTLPQITFDTDDVDDADVTAEFRKRFGRDVRMLRMLHERRDDAARRTELLFHLEDFGSASEAPSALRWAEMKEMPDGFGLPSALADLIRATVVEIESGIVPSGRRPWARPGWHAGAEAWMRTAAAGVGYEVTGPVEEVRTWAISRVLRMPTDRGSLYFKASGGSRLFCKEAQVTAGLATRFPAHVPKPIAIEPNQGWILTPDFGGPIGSGTTAQRADALRQFATLQVKAVSSIADLLALGCADRRLPILAGQIRHLLTKIAPGAGVTEAEITRLKSSLSPLEALCARLATYRVPPTLMHGDLHMNNIAVRGPGTAPGYLFFDWTDACISHPFLDLIAIRPKMETSDRLALTNAYLEPWTAFEPMPRLLDMTVMAMPLVAMHQAVSYSAIDEGCEAPMMYGDQTAFSVWLREALESLPAACRVAGLVQ